MAASFFQIIGLAAILAAGVLEFGLPGGLAGGGLGAVYVGLAMERN